MGAGESSRGHRTGANERRKAEETRKAEEIRKGGREKHWKE